MPSSSTSNYQIFSYVVLLVFAGTVDSISKKTLNINHSLGKKFKHPFFVTFLMFLGEIVCLIFYMFGNTDKKKQTKEGEKEESIALSQIEREENLKPELSIYMLIVPTILDLIATTINTIGLTMLAGSAYQMMRGASILFVAILARFYLKTKLRCFHYVAIMLVLTGLMLIGSSNKIIPFNLPQGCKKGDSEESLIWGFILVFISTFFVASQLTVEEEITKNYKCSPLKAVGWEGVFGTSMYVVILFALQFVKCTAPPKGKITWTTLMCTQNDHGEWRVEDSIFAIKQIYASPLLLLNCIIFSLSVAAINFAGVTVTKLASAGARSITEPIRTITIWAFFMLPIVNHCSREHFNFVQLIGFLFLIAGNLIYNQIVKLPYAKVEELDIDSENSKIGTNYQTITQDNEMSKTGKV